MKKSQGPYRIEALDADGNILAEAEETTLRDAKECARNYIYDPEYVASGLRKTEVLDIDGVNVADYFVRESLGEYSGGERTC
jgi:hypothetical protein